MSRFPMHVSSVAVAAALLLALTACGGDDTADEAAPGGGDTGAASAVELTEFAIDAPSTAPTGEFTVTNAGNAPHTFTAEDGTFDTGTLAAGESATVTIDQPGTYAYVCSIHPGQMNGTIEIS